jgi:predicted nucleic acid-binding Zn ribbon protein
VPETQVLRIAAPGCFVRSVKQKRGRAQPSPVAEALTAYLRKSGLRERVEQGEVVSQWPALVGPKIAAVTEPLHVSADGVLFVAVKTSAWMSELSLLEPELLRAVNGRGRTRPVSKIRFRLMR